MGTQSQARGRSGRKAGASGRAAQFEADARAAYADSIVRTATGEVTGAVAASRRACELEPESQRFANDLGWSLLEAGRLPDAEATLTRAVAMDPADELARENLRLCKLKVTARARRGSAR
jgi:Flp pilus assembly protein TadD